MRTFALSLISLYQRAVSPYLPSVCCYTPSCSHYSNQAILKFGLWRGGWLTLRRLARCHPFAPGGYDPVP